METFQLTANQRAACGKSCNTQDPCSETPGMSGHLGSENTIVHSLPQCPGIFYHFLAPEVASKEQKEEETCENMPKVVYGLSNLDIVFR